MRPPAPPPPSGFLHRRGEPTGVAMGAGFAQLYRHNVNQFLPGTAYVPAAHVDQALFRIPATACVPAAATPVAPYVPAGAAPHASAAPPLPNPRQGRRNKRRKRRRDYLAEQAAASSRDPSLTPAPAPGTHDPHAATSCPPSSAAATAAVPVSHVPASASSLVHPLSCVPAVRHVSATRPTPLYRVPAVPAVPTAFGASSFHVSRVPAAEPHTAVTSTVPRASAFPADPHFSPPRDLSKRATPTGSAFSAPRKFSQRPAPAAEESHCQVAGTVGPSAPTGHMPPPRPYPACPPRPMPPPPSPLSHTAAAALRASASPAVDRCSPPRELSHRIAASGCSQSPPRELSQRPVATEEDDCQIAGAVRTDRVRSMHHAPPLHTFRVPSHRLPGHSQLASRELSQCAAGSGCGYSSVRAIPAPVGGGDWEGQLPECRGGGPCRSRPNQQHATGGCQDGERGVARVKSVPGEMHGMVGVGQEEESKASTEELRRELERVSKEMNDLKNEFAELKKSMKNKDLEIEAKEAEIQSFKKAKVNRYLRRISGGK